MNTTECLHSIGPSPGLWTGLTIPTWQRREIVRPEGATAFWSTWSDPVCESPTTPSSDIGLLRVHGAPDVTGAETIRTELTW